MALLDKGKALRSLPKTPALLRFILQGVTQAEAMNSWDADWNVVFVVCHLRDLEAAYLQRVHMMLDEDNPTFPANDQRAMAIERRYAEADLTTTLGEFEALRREFIALLGSLSDEQWERRGQHPYFGETTILTQAVNNAIHDLDHIEQIARALGKTSTWE
ncbi:MAG: DinB family protein [Anaerolineaceae bacterium]|nr:DinB family protein [Anaerolineaceae bacterium]